MIANAATVAHATPAIVAGTATERKRPARERGEGTAVAPSRLTGPAIESSVDSSQKAGGSGDVTPARPRRALFTAASMARAPGHRFSFSTSRARSTTMATASLNPVTSDPIGGARCVPAATNMA
jgi:hypothetical protein